MVILKNSTTSISFFHITMDYFLSCFLFIYLFFAIHYHYLIYFFDAQIVPVLAMRAHSC